MKDYWSSLPPHIRGSKKGRFNYLMNIITEAAGKGGSGSQDQPKDAGEEAEPSKYNISISVKNGEGEGIASASVAIGEDTKTTGSAGGCSFHDIEEGQHEIAVSAEGFEDYSDAITVNENNTSFDIVLTASE